MVEAVRIVERALGEVHFGASPREHASLAFRRSLFVVEDVKAGQVFSCDNLRSIRPAHGLHTRSVPEVLGKRAARDIERGTPPAAWGLVENEVLAFTSRRPANSWPLGTSIVGSGD